MTNNSKLQNKTAYELEKDRIRFNGCRGQTQGVAHQLNIDWVEENKGAFAFPVHIDKKDNK